MSAAFALAMSMLCKEPEPEPYQATKGAKAPKPKDDSTKIVPASNSAKKSKVVPFTFVMASGIDAETFLVSLREVGKRKVLNHLGIEIVTYDPTLAREDTIKAIAAYDGYDYNGSFGTQETMARAKAIRERNGIAWLRSRRI